MFKLTAFCSTLLIFFALPVAYGQQAAKKAPDQITIKAKNGNILFNHKTHAAAAKQDCTTCHPKFWPQDATKPVNFRFPHKTHEAKHTSCGFCHHEGGQSFQASAAANCKKCHGTAKK